MSQGPPEFAVQFAADGDELVGARWWNESAKLEPRFPRRKLAKLVLYGGLVAGGAVLINALVDDDLDDIEVADALELQRSDGWDVGRGTATLRLAEATNVDVDGGRTWAAEPRLLAVQLEPPERLRPFYVSTLFQALDQDSLRAQMRPVHSWAGDVAHERARAFAELLREADPRELAVILDLPEEESVAAAAALAEERWPVFGYGNWPHPRGVVDSQHALGAALYYLPAFLRAKAKIPSDRAPMFVLDSTRLAPYGDNPEQFDNRYVAKLPSAENLRALGVRSVMYVRAGAPAVELDDLNDDFVEYGEAGIDVRFVSLGDFTAGTPSADAGVAERPRHYFGGSPATHLLFWPMYASRGFPSSMPGGPSIPVGPVGPVGPRGSTRFEPRPNVQYRPAPRDTLFSARRVGGMAGVGKQKPSGFGLVSRRGGRLVGPPGSFERSGSFGRSSGNYFSG
jgi:hypothetical protein